MTHPEPEPFAPATDRPATDAPPEAVDLMAALKASLDKAKAARERHAERWDEPFPSAFQPCSHEGEHPEVTAHLDRERPAR